MIGRNDFSANCFMFIEKSLKKARVESIRANKACRVAHVEMLLLLFRVCCVNIQGFEKTASQKRRALELNSSVFMLHKSPRQLVKDTNKEKLYEF